MQEAQKPQSPNVGRIKLAVVVLTILGMALFAYLIYAVGFWEIVDGIARFGWLGFGIILSLYFVRLVMRALAWKLSVHPPYELSLRDTLPAVIIGEAMSSTIPLGIVASGTSKALVVRDKVTLTVGLSSVATENLFYSFTTALFLIAGGAVMAWQFDLSPEILGAINFIVVTLIVLVALGIVMVVRQWHMASWCCEWLYQHGWFKRLLEKGRFDVRRFEDLIYGFYREFPGRFIPICILEIVYHLFGVAEVWYILTRISEFPSFTAAFLLESISRLINVVFKLVPFLIGVDEAGARFVGESLALAAGVGVTLAVIRKGRIFFWSIAGIILLIKRGLSIRHLHEWLDTPETDKTANT
ncbi:MAG: flippase-like domain-containing protein [Acidobacteria bacterium]|nr:flippase-like domain-containing protein [Acidobacteriota bacterium]